MSFCLFKVSTGAMQADIKMAYYHKKACKCHTDKNLDNPQDSNTKIVVAMVGRCENSRVETRQQMDLIVCLAVVSFGSHLTKPLH
jgi:hypothetical protein